MKKMFKLLIGCFVLVIFLVVVLACVLFFFGKQIWDRVAPFFGKEPRANISNTYSGEPKASLPASLGGGPVLLERYFQEFGGTRNGDVGPGRDKLFFSPEPPLGPHREHRGGLCGLHVD